MYELTCYYDNTQVTGGSSGIGKEIARLAVLKDANVTIVARNQVRVLKL